MKSIFRAVLSIVKGSLDNVPLMLVGNKCDETEARELTAKEGEEQARRWSSHFMETSAKTNYNVKELFQVRSKALRGFIDLCIYVHVIAYFQNYKIKKIIF